MKKGKKLIIAAIIVVCCFVLLHVSVNYLVPMVKEMHQGMFQY